MFGFTDYNMTGHLTFVKTYFERAEKRETQSKLVRLVLNKGEALA